MSTSGPSRKFQFGPGWFIFLGIIGLVVFNKNSRLVVKSLMEQVKVQTKRMDTDFNGLKSTLEKGRQEQK